MKIRTKTKNPLLKMASKGFRGYPIATIAFYGPDNKRASKVAVGIVAAQDQEPVALERWFSDATDARGDKRIQAGILEFLKLHKPKSVVATDRIIGVAHTRRGKTTLKANRVQPARTGPTKTGLRMSRFSDLTDSFHADGTRAGAGRVR